MKDFTQLFEAIITLLVVLITTFVIPYIKTKINADDLAEAKKWTKIAVQTAEMIYTESGMGQKKKNYVLNFLAAYGITYDEEQINALIESAVYELKLELK